MSLKTAIQKPILYAFIAANIAFGSRALAEGLPDRINTRIECAKDTAKLTLSEATALKAEAEKGIRAAKDTILKLREDSTEKQSRKAWLTDLIKKCEKEGAQVPYKFLDEYTELIGDLQKPIPTDSLSMKQAAAVETAAMLCKYGYYEMATDLISSALEASTDKGMQQKAYSWRAYALAQSGQYGAAITDIDAAIACRSAGDSSEASLYLQKAGTYNNWMCELLKEAGKPGLPTDSIISLMEQAKQCKAFKQHCLDAAKAMGN